MRAAALALAAALAGTPATPQEEQQQEQQQQREDAGRDDKQERMHDQHAKVHSHKGLAELSTVQKAKGPGSRV